ncbi:hypothetical protein CASFOL_004404 [Castilleja foliolosa]|uniref:Uncharacterized protein n=1 Tax=Castilleja foliolosa TaxID=1961234 RepID=A0ABD3EAV5_9LAMI
MCALFSIFSLLNNRFIFLYTFAIIFSKPHLAQSHCKNRPIIFNFGDSNSDTGGLVAGLGFPVNLPNGRSFFGRSTGRLSDGLLVIDFLCESLNTSLLSPYLDSLSSTSFSNGANFAIVGSATLPRYVPFALHIQLMQFEHFKDRSAEYAAAGVDRLIGPDKFGDALYMIDIGQNDIADSFSKGLSYLEVVKKIPSILVEIKNAVKEIYGQGGRKIWVHNTGPLGCLPQKLASVKNTSSFDLDSVGCVSSYNDAARLFNEGLRRVCTDLRSEMKDAVIVYVDVFAIKLDLIANSTMYSFSTPLMACCGSGGPPYNYDKRVTCGSHGYQVCDRAAKLVSWDGVHYTEAANDFISSKILSGDYSTPRVTFDFFCQ